MITTLRRHWYRSQLHRRKPSVLVDYMEGRLPARHDRLSECEFLVVDLELTGLSKNNDEIVSIGFVPIINQEILLAQAEHHILKTSKSVGASATVHGIHDRHCGQGVSLLEGLSYLIKALKGKVIVCHCAPLDIGFLNAACLQQFNAPLICRAVDTMAIERERFQRRGQVLSSDSLRLQGCRNRYGFPKHNAHNALSDAIATAELLLAQMSHMGGSNQTRLQSLLTY